MNKSLALKNKLYLFLSLVLFFLIFLYLIFFIVNGERGLISYYKIKNQQVFLNDELNKLIQENIFYEDRIKRLQPNTIDLDYLDEKLRDKSGFLDNNEIIVFLD